MVDLAAGDTSMKVLIAEDDDDLRRLLAAMVSAHRFEAVEARDGRFGMMANTSYAEAFMYSRSTTFESLPLPESVLHREFVPNDLPGDQVIAWQTPSATPPEAYRRRG